MFYENENEKDFIQNGSDLQISEDGVVSWSDDFENASGDVVNTSDNLISDNNVILSDSIDSDDEIQLVQSSDEPDEDELRRILSEGDTSNNEVSVGEESETTDEEFDFDEELLQSGSDDEVGDDAQEDIPIEEITPRKSPSQSEGKRSALPVLIALLIAIFAVGGGYWVYTFLQENNASSGDLQVNNQVKDVTSEDLENRNNAVQEDIPIVNEDTKDAIKVQEQQQMEMEALRAAEKMETVDIKTGGRNNPFLPGSKYLSVSVPESYINFENTSIPKPPDTYGSKDNKALEMLNISVSGIMYDDMKPSAIITYENNDYFVQRGDKLNEYRVIDIGKNFVLIALGRNTYKASVGEEFKITSDFYGNAKYLPTGKQYYTVKKGDSGSSNDNNRQSSGSSRLNNNYNNSVELDIE